MKRLILLLFIPLLSFYQQINGTKVKLAADVARNINNISDFEKDIVLYHNLVRIIKKIS